MSRSRRRQSLTSLFVLLWQGAVLAPAGMVAHAAETRPSGESQRVAQLPAPATSKPTTKGIPAEVEKWFDAMTEAADKGDSAAALRLHDRVLGWARANLPEKHLFRARLMERQGYVLAKTGKYPEAMVATRDGTDMLRELSRSNQDPDTRYFLSMSLYSLGRRYMELKQAKPAAASFKEALSILREQATIWSDSLDLLPQNMLLLGQQLEEIGELDSAVMMYSDALPIFHEQGKLNPHKRELYGMTLSVLAGVRFISGKYEAALSHHKEALQIYRGLTQTHPKSRQLLPLTLKLIGGTYFTIAKAESKVKLYRLAEDFFQEAITVWSTYPKSTENDIEIAKVLSLQGLSYWESGQTQKSLDSRREAIRILRKLPETSIEGKKSLASQLQDLGLYYRLLNDTQNAYPLYQEAVKIYQYLIVGSPELRAEYASALDNLRSLYDEIGETQLSLKAAEGSVHIHRELRATDLEGLTSFAGALSGLAGLYSNLDQQERALEFRRESVALRRRAIEAMKNNENLTMQYSRMLNLGSELESDYWTFLILDLSLLSSNYAVLGKFEDALAASEEAVTTARNLVKTHKSGRELLADQLTVLSSRFSDLGQLNAALDANLEAVHISRDLAKGNTKGRDQLSNALYELSLRYNALGRRQEALASSREALAMRRDQTLTDSQSKSQLADSMTVVAYNLANLGQPQDAVFLAQDAVTLFRQLDKQKRQQKANLAWGLSLLSFYYSQSGEHHDALSVAGESISIYRELAKKDSLYSHAMASPLIVLGTSQNQLGDFELAIANTAEAISLLRKARKTDLSKSTELAVALNNLSRFQATLGRQVQAMTLSRESVAILRELSKSTPAVLDNLSKSIITLAALSLHQGNAGEAIPLLREAVSNEVRFLQQQLPLMPESRRQALVNTLGQGWGIPFSLANEGEAGASLALYTRLNRHSPLQDIERRQALISRSTSATKAMVARLSVLNAQLSNPSITSQARANALVESERLQEEIPRQLPAIQPRLVEISEVAHQLPADGVLIEFQRFSPYSAAKPGKEVWGHPRYLALLLDPRGTIKTVDLGEADALDQAIATALDRTRFQQPGADRTWALVAEKVFSPLQGALEGKRQLLLSPDGQLHRVPFNALALLAGVTPSLPADLVIHTIGSGRDLVTATGRPSPTSAPLVLANPTTKGWAPLTRATSEGQSVAAALGGQLLLGSAASVTVVEQARGPRVLHVAGHGYFDPQATGDPLLASGLALAGADKDRQPSRPSSPTMSSSIASVSTQMDDGYLTAKEATRLQLDGTQLVVLSACETGLGQQRNGEGVFGLQRALTVAGARGSLLSLWKVPDAATETFMTRFYAHLGQGIPPAKAVRLVQTEFRNKPRVDGWSDPFYWAGWQYSGLPDRAR
jgi:CHAT domain-containing protein/tetratricopeptide (TPR) repeat protein